MTTTPRSGAVSLVVMGSVLVGLGRFTVPGHGLSWPGTYEAFAHIWVGVLLCLGFVGNHRKLAWVALVATSLLELMMAALR